MPWNIRIGPVVFARLSGSAGSNRSRLEAYWSVSGRHFGSRPRHPHPGARERKSGVGQQAGTVSVSAQWKTAGRCHPAVL